MFDSGNGADSIPDLTAWLETYRRLAATTLVSDIESMESELLDRFGPLPWQVQNLLYVVRLKARARRGGVQSITREDGQIVLRLHKEVGGAKSALQRVLPRGFDVGHYQIRLDLGELRGVWEGPLMEGVGKLAEFRKRLVIFLE